MTTSTPAGAAETAVAVLLSELVDDAGLFPPEELSMPAALRRFHEQEDNPLVTGRFLCPGRRLQECAELVRSGERLPLGLICPLEPQGLRETLRAIAAEPRLHLASVEGALPADRSALAAPAAGGPPTYVELAIDASLAASLEWLATCGLRAKVRCGGSIADLFPPAEALARFIRGCADVGVSFKATAGLHHAVAHTDTATGFDHHGFLNLGLAAARAVAGATEPELVEVLRTTNAESLVAEAIALTPDSAAAARELFVCYGSCSTTESLEDLVALGLLPAEVA
jgi:hypothetical protein